MAAEATLASLPRRRPASPARRPALRSRPATTPGAEMGRAARSRAMRLNLLAGLVVLGAALLHAWTGLTVNRLGYELSRARELSQRLDRQLNELRIEYSAMTKPDLLAEQARRLGLDWPKSGQVVDLP
jgi:hypothetical protein